MQEVLGSDDRPRGYLRKESDKQNIFLQGRSGLEPASINIEDITQALKGIKGYAEGHQQTGSVKDNSIMDKAESGT